MGYHLIHRGLFCSRRDWIAVAAAVAGNSGQGVAAAIGVVIAAEALRSMSDDAGDCDQPYAGCLRGRSSSTDVAAGADGSEPATDRADCTDHHGAVDSLPLPNY